MSRRTEPLSPADLDQLEDLTREARRLIGLALDMTACRMTGVTRRLLWSTLGMLERFEHALAEATG